MTDRPIIFSAPMVRALLDGRKSQTRRLLKLAGRRPDYIGPKGCTGDPACWGWDNGDGGYILADRDPSDKFAASWHDFAASYSVGDRLWVREALICATENMGKFASFADVVCYAEDGSTALREFQMVNWPWKRETLNVRFMPRWASRLTLIVTDVRVQRVQSITEADAVAEGVCETAFWERAEHKVSAGAPWSVDRLAFADLWNSIHGPDAWDRNDWVAALTFTTHRQNIDQMETTND